MRCPFCKKLGSFTVDSRRAKKGTAYRRRRECLKCGRRWTTYERVQVGAAKVQHRDGRVERFRERVLLSCLERHCAKLPVRSSYRIAAGAKLLEQLRTEGRLLPTETLAVWVTETLMELHPTAALRFALEWRRPQDMADVLEIVWQFVEKPGVFRKQG